MRQIYKNTHGQNTIYVFEDFNGVRSLKINHLAEVHSIYDPDEVLIEPGPDHYWNFFNIFPLVHTSMKRVLLLGLGAGSVSRQLAHFFPGIEIDGIEVDPHVIAVASEYFNLAQPGLHVHQTDGIRFLQDCDGGYDMIILDAFVKRNLSEDFVNDTIFSLAKKKLAPHGFLVANYIFAIPLARNLHQEFKAHFSHTWRVQIKDASNYIIFGSDYDWDLKNVTLKDSQSPLSDLVRYIGDKVEKL